MAHALARAGAQVIATDKDEADLLALDDALRAEGLKATLHPTTLLRPSGIDKLALAIAQRFERLDILVSAAAILGTMSPVALSDPKDWEEVMKVNVLAQYRLIRACDPLLKQSKAGRAVFFSCPEPVEAAAPFWAPYSVSKAAADIMVRTWANEIQKSTVRVALVDPGRLRGSLRRRAYPGEDEALNAPPDVVVPTVMELLRPESHVHGETVRVDHPWRKPSP